MKRKKEFSWRNVFVFILFGILFISIGIMLNEYKSSIANSKILNSIFPIYQGDNETEFCMNESLEDTAYCLRLQLSQFYKYNITNAGRSLNENELKNIGGVCSHYSSWWANEARKRGFNAITPVFKINDTAWHQVAIISDETGYCLLDQIGAIGCTGLGNG